MVSHQVDRNSMVGPSTVNGKNYQTVKFSNLPRQELVIDLPEGKLDRFQPLFEDRQSAVTCVLRSIAGA